MADGAVPAKKGYAPLRLHGVTATGWSVISLANGAIASDRDDRLLNRLSEPDARRIAAEMTASEESGG